MNTDAERAQFVDTHRASLIQRVTVVMPIADELLSRGMLHQELYCQITAAQTNQDKMRKLYAVLHSGGNAVKAAFYSGLEKHEPFLLEDLEPLMLCSEERESQDCSSSSGSRETSVMSPLTCQSDDLRS